MDAELVVDKLSIELIRRHLVTEMIGRHMDVFDHIASTNVALRELATAGAEEGTVVLAEGQSAGRGRMGQAWFSPPGLNLYISVLTGPCHRLLTEEIRPLRGRGFDAQDACRRIETIG